MIQLMYPMSQATIAACRDLQVAARCRAWPMASGEANADECLPEIVRSYMHVYMKTFYLQNIIMQM